MAFKKAKGKGKVAKKKGKKSGGKKDEWSHEGGLQVLDGREAENQDGTEKRKRRLTQDREESIRRGKLKNNDRKRKKDFKVKMSKKVKFGDILAEPTDAAASDNESEAEAPRTIEFRPNPLDVMDRLKVFVNKSLQQRVGKSDSEDGGDSDLDAGEDGDADSLDSDQQEDSGDEESGDEDEEVDGAEVDDRDVQDEDADEYLDADSGDEQEASAKADFYFDHQFNNLDSAQPGTERPKMRKLATVGNSSDEVHGTLGFDGKAGETGNGLPVYPGPFKSVSQVPGLHKLFRGSAASHRIDDAVMDEQNGTLLPYFASYSDAFIEGRDGSNDAKLLQGMLFHAVSHTVKARAKVVKHNQKLKRKLRDSMVASAVAKEAAGGKASKKKNKATQELALVTGAEDNDAMRDQGFCRPRVLILCPFRGTALQIVKQIKELLGENTSISGWDKLKDEFSAPEDEEEDGPDSKKPEDWKELFGKQNIDDDFKMGIQLNPGHGKGSGAAKGVYMRLFSDFFISDIILASPIGLRLAVGAPVKEKSKGDKNKKPTELSADFLSSVEMVLMHQADVMYMQNWEHVEYIMQHTNKLPTAAHDTDFSRVRQYFLEGQGALHRQLLVTSHFNEPELQAFYREHARSGAGSIRLKKHWGKGQLPNVMGNVKQVFQLVPGVKDFASQEDARFKYFKDNVLAPVLRLQQKHTLIVTPSYLSYVRVRNELMQQEVKHSTVLCVAIQALYICLLFGVYIACTLCVTGECSVYLRVQQRQ